jgi:integrase/recombinase XerD
MHPTKTKIVYCKDGKRNGKFFFRVTLDRPDLTRHLSTIHEPRKAPVILSPDEMARFLEAAPGIKYKRR